MGNSQSVFTEQELNDYQDLTYFSKNEILHVFKRFAQLDQNAVGQDKNAKLKRDIIMDLPELKVNPFKDRICQVFSSSKDGDMTFEDFLDMMSVFSENAPKSVKVEYAFKIYDFDEDDMLSRSDLKEVVDRLTAGGPKLNDDQNLNDDQKLNDEQNLDIEKQKLNDEEMKTLTDNIFKEADLDNDDLLSFAEFEHVISKSPDFINSFRIRL